MLALLTVAFAFLVGVVATASGIGGGSFLVPFLVMVYGLPPVVAVGSSLMVIFPASLAAAIQYSLRGYLDRVLAPALLIPAAAGSMVGAAAAAHISGSALSLFFGLVLVAIGLWSELLRDRLEGSAVPSWRWLSFPPVLSRSYPSAVSGEPGDVVRIERRVSLPVLLLTGFLAGFLGAILGIGGGFLVTPVLIFLFRVPARMAVAASMALIAAVSLAGAVTHLSLGHVSLHHTLLLGTGLLAGSLLGPYLVERLPEASIRRLISGVLMVLGLLMVGRSLS